MDSLGTGGPQRRVAPSRNLGIRHLLRKGGAPCLVWLGERPLGVTLCTMLPCLGWACLIWEWPGHTLCGETGFSGHSGKFLSLCFCVPNLGHCWLGGAISRESMLTLVEAIYQGHLGANLSVALHPPFVHPAPTLSGHHTKGRGTTPSPGSLIQTHFWTPG